MNKEIMKQAGFVEEIELVENGKCPLCKTPVDTSQFTMEISIKKFKISGLCQKCQDEVFGGQE